MKSSRPKSSEEQTEADVKKPRLMNTIIAAFAGGVAGGYASFIFEGMKKRLQSNQTLPNPLNMTTYKWLRESFRGANAFTCSLVPTGIFQQVTKHVLEEKGIAHTPMGETIGNVAAGAVGGVASAGVENVILWQQLGKSGPYEAIQRLFSESPTAIFRGIFPVMAREAMFGVCYLKLAGEAGKYAKENFGNRYELPAQIVVGTIGSLASHPFDTTATTMQKYKFTFSQAVTHLWEEGGLGSFYKGCAARVFLFTTAMMVISQTSEKVLSRLTDKTDATEAPSFKR